MKITGLKTFIVDAGNSNWVFVKVHTDQGLTGIGEGSITSKAQTMAVAIMEHERWLVGKDPLQIERLWQGMYRYARWRGGPVLCSAISAIDMALWDILGKYLKVPVYQLLGGLCRDRVRMYAHCHGQGPEEAAEHALKLKAQGYTAIKTTPLVVKDGVLRVPECIRDGYAKIAAIRKAVGEDMDVALDAHGQTTPPMAVEVAKAMEPLHPLFLEETTQPEDLEILAWVAARVNVPLATGERLFMKWAFTELCARKLVSYIQPDVVHCGGISELKRIAAIAEAHFIECAPHNPQSEVSTMASLHVDFSTTNCTIQEQVHESPPWRYDLFEGGAVIGNGFAEPPTAPGLGIDLSEKEAAKHPYRQDFRPNWVWPDGAVADY